MYTQDLDYFAIDCSRRDEQVRFLLSQLSTNDDRLLSWWTNYMDPLGPLRNSPDYGLRVDIASRMINWQVGQNLLHIKHYCG